MRKVFYSVVGLLAVLAGTATAQTKHFTRDGKVHFYGKTSMEVIEATNNKVTSIIDISTGQIEFAVLVKAFEFDRALMQEHFNENYLESDKFPKATFKGTFTNASEIKWTTDGTYAAKVSGKLTIHGVTKDFTGEGQVVVKAGKISATSEFVVALSDYDIKIPGVVKDKISPTMKVDVELNYEPYTASK